MTQENVELVRATYEAWNTGNMDAMLAVLHPDFEYVPTGLFPDLAPVYRGHEGWRAFWRDFRGTWESLNIAMDELRDLDDEVVTLFTFEGRGRAGLEVRRQFGNIWTFRDGLVVRIQAFADWSATLKAAGLRE